MPAPGEDRFFTELRGSTAELARIIDGDLERLSSSGVTASARAHHRTYRWPSRLAEKAAAAQALRGERPDRH